MRTPSRDATLIGAILFLLGAWPLLLCDPPLQDLPNHMAAAELLLHPEHAHGLASTGLLRTNALVFAFLFGVGRVVGVRLAGRLFVACVLALMAFALPRFVLAFGNRRKMIASAFLAGPLVHQWFVCVGSVNYVASVAGALLLLIALESQLRAPSIAGGFRIVALSLFVWYAHVIGLGIAGMLVLLELAWIPWANKRRALVAVGLPLVPAGLLVISVLFDQVHGADVAHAGLPTSFLDPLGLLSCWWKNLYGGFTALSMPSVVMASALAWFGVKHPARGVSLVGARGALLLVVAYCVLPASFATCAFLNLRMLPFLGAALLLCVPETLPSRARWAFGVVSALVSLALGVDYVRLDRDRQAYVSGIDAVPEGATVLPLTFVTRRTSSNTHSLAHAWGYYAIAKHTDAPLVFSDSTLFAWTWPGGVPALEHTALWAQDYRAPECTDLEDAASRARCLEIWADGWRSYFDEAAARYDTILLWEAPPAVVTACEKRFQQVFATDALVVMRRR